MRTLVSNVDTTCLPQLITISWISNTPLLFLSPRSSIQLTSSPSLYSRINGVISLIGRIGYHNYFDKTTVLQEARVFNESPINARKCRALLTKILYLISLGETFGTTEATELFFSVTKLFQSKDVRACKSG